MTTKEMVDVMEGYVSGKEIQVKYISGSEWGECKNPIWDWSAFCYRIKPEEPKDEYRPFTYEESCLNVGYAIVRKDGSDKRLIHSVNNRCKPFQINGMTAEYILDNYYFEDGSPCGVKLEV